GSETDEGRGTAADPNENAYGASHTGSTNFPVTTPLQAAYAGGEDAFVTKLTPAGVMQYSTYLGGSRFDQGNGIAADPTGNAYVTGFTASTNFPTMNALQPAYAGGDRSDERRVGTAG